jgi:hypothetical protein
LSCRSRPVFAAYFFIDPFFVSVRECLELLKFLDELLLFLFRSGSNVRFGQHPVDPLKQPQSGSQSLLSFIKRETMSHLLIAMHRLPMNDVPVSSLFLEVGDIARRIEGGFPELTVLLGCSGFERHLKCTEVLRVWFVSAARGQASVIHIVRLTFEYEGERKATQTSHCSR